ncbi:MAG: type secretion system tip protein VgrG [Pseudomonadota bacterium]|jgi:type VI secretion system secreted protein VgrG
MPRDPLEKTRAFHVETAPYRTYGPTRCRSLWGPEVMPLERFATVTTPAGDALKLHTMHGSDALSEPFAYDLELFSTDPNLQESDLIGHSVTVHLELGNQSVRHFNGIVASFGFAGMQGRHFVYHATLRPWLWLLSHASDCKIFQRTSVPDIVASVFRDHGFSDFELALSGTYPEREYVVQYRETTLSFVSRLLEQEGIYYYFQHEDGQHRLFLADSVSAHETQPGYEQVPYYPPGNSLQREFENLEQWVGRKQLRTGSYTLNDFDFKKPRADLVVRTSLPGDYAHSDNEFYDYPGEYEVSREGERYVRARMEELQGMEFGFQGNGSVRGLGSGRLFTLREFPRDVQNCEYLVVSADYAIEVDEFESSTLSTGAMPFSCTLRATESKTPFVAPRSTPRPTISGPQTATVVGKAGEEIWTDEYGRVKVQFHWDRQGKRDENSSCWVRVAQVWAGSGWGGIHIPRIGQEVMVEFLEGDPDRPIITGRVYNRDNMPPYALPQNQTQSGIKSRSSKGATLNNFNELRFEDKKAEEQLYMQAERNMDTLVKNDQTLTVNRHRDKKITENETTWVGGDRSEEVIGNETIEITGTRTETVQQTETIRLEQARSTTITLGDTLKVGQAYLITVGAGSAMGVTGSHALTISESHSLKVAGSDSQQIGKDQNVQVTGARVTQVKSDSTKAGTSIVIDAGSEITLKTGAASITLKSNGDIALSGKTITMNGSDKVNIRAKSDVQIKGSRNAQN